MQHFRRMWTVVGALALGASIASAQSAETGPAKGPDVDNTRVNKADRNDTRTTPQGQSSAKADRELTAAVRKAIVRDKSLSTYAHNVKVIAINETVTLRGPVRSEEEKRNVEQKAAEVAGASNVKSEITVVAADNKRSSKASSTNKSTN